MSNKVSIIITVYNCEKYIRECINSIINQTYKDIEIIIVDDGSTDDSYKICESIKDNRIKLFTHKNKGVSYSRNKGIAKSSGKFIMFVDSDDFLDKNTIEIMVSKMNKHSLDLIYCNLEYFDESRKYYPYKINKDLMLENNFDDIKKSIISLNYLQKHSITNYGPIRCIGGKLYSSKIIKENNLKFNEDIFLLEDGLFNLNYLDYAKKVMYLNKPLYKYRQLTSSTSYKYNENQLNQYDLIYEELQKHLKDNSYYLSYYLNAFELISTYFFRYYKYNDISRKDFNKIANSILQKQIYLNAIKNTKYFDLTLKDKIKLFCYKTKNYNLLYIFMVLRNRRYL